MLEEHLCLMRVNPALTNAQPDFTIKKELDVLLHAVTTAARIFCIGLLKLLQEFNNLGCEMDFHSIVGVIHLMKEQIENQQVDMTACQSP